MKNFIYLAILGFGLTGCASSLYNTSSPVGMIYNGSSTGISANNGVPITKTGESCFHTVLGFAIGDATIDDAMKNGNIAKVATVDHTSFDILVYGKQCTVVQGS